MYLRILLILIALLLYALPGRGGHFMHDDAEATVAILMFDGVQIIDFAAPYEVFGQARFNVYTVSADGGAVTTAMGLNVSVDHGFDDAPAADIVVVPGGDVDTVRKHEATLAWLRQRSGVSDQVLSVCTGSFILADAGLLDGGRATTFHRAFGNFEREYPDVKLVRDQRWVDNGKIVTSAGLASGIDASLHVVAERLGMRRARAIALHLEYDWSPDQGFVRGLLADRHILMPSEKFQFPEGTKVDTLLQLGDERHWEIEYEIESSWSAQELIVHVSEVAARDSALTLIQSDSPLATGWRYDSEHGGEWMLRIEAEPAGEDGAFRARSTVSPAK